VTSVTTICEPVFLWDAASGKNATVTIHLLNCLTCSARVPSRWHSGALCLLIESDQGLALVDTGLGEEDYQNKTSISPCLNPTCMP
jgi:hypothetical protein